MITGHGDVRSLICGVTNTTATIICQNIFVPVYCDITLATRWCTLGETDGGGRPVRVYSDQTKLERLPASELTDPDPTPGQWSCTVESLGRPVVWRLQTRDYLAHTVWFGHWKSDQMYTHLRFDLNNSAFSGRPGGGLITDIGIRDNWGPEVGSLTPWLRGFNPAQTFHSGDRDNYFNLGWNFYNVLDWSVRFDVSAGYMELNHSWYCDDKDPSRP
jgi:hypothetical protein